MAKKIKRDCAMSKAVELFDKSSLTQQQLGEAMGYDAESARKSVSQFLKTDDPRISMLRRFAKAMDIPLSELVE